MYIIQTPARPIRPGNDFFDRKGQYDKTRYNPDGMHVGNDSPCREGTPVRALVTGRVVFADRFGALGKLVVIKDKFDRCWGSAHLSEIETVVGRRVRRRDVIGAAGDTTSPDRDIAPHVHHFGTEDDAWLDAGWGESPYFNTWPTLMTAWTREWGRS